VIRRPVKIGVAGTHSTGKSSFLKALAPILQQLDLKPTSIGGLADRARALGFPILAEHNFESTLWIMAECLRQEAEASLHSDVILIDRPIADALGYLLAALEVSGRQEDPRRIEELKAIARAHTGDYDVLIVTSLNQSIPLGHGRDSDPKLRVAASKHIDALISEFAPDAWHLTSSNTDELVARARAFVSLRIAAESTA
jgi:hypothetical protein